MELRGQDKEIGMPSTLGYNSPNKDSSSSKLISSSSALAASSLGDRIRDQIGHGNSIFSPPTQTLDHHHHRHLPFHHHQPQQLNPQPQKSSRRDPDQDPDPVPPPSATTTPAAPNTASTAVNAAAAASSSSSSSVRYRECLKNHAASTGGHVLDGCGEFMPSGEDDSSGALKCAACECHRNFHRKEIDGGESSQYVPNSAFYSYNPNNNKENGRRSSLSTLSHAQHPPPQLSLQPHLHHQQHHHHHHQRRLRPIPPMMMAFGGGVGTAAESSSEDLNMFQSNYVGGQASVLHQQPISGSRKRFRTKFTQPQKDKMMEFAEKLGWKIQKHDDQEVQQFCSEVGVKRKAFKVWMHNNKQAMKKKQEV